jgi:PilZ domain
MEGQLTAGQWVEVSMEDLPTPVLLNGFVLSLRPSELLLTFPELREPPKGLESEAQAVLRYSNPAGHYTAIGHILRVASGPPVTVTFKRLSGIGSDTRRSLVRTVVSLPVLVHVVTSSVGASLGCAAAAGHTQNLSSSGMLLEISLLLAVGDVVRVEVSGPSATVVVHGRVVRVCESEAQGKGAFGVGIAFVHDSEEEHDRWLEFAADFQARR